MFLIRDTQGVEHGPYNDEVIKQWIIEKRYNLFTPAKRISEDRWKMIGSFCELSVTRASSVPAAKPSPKNFTAIAVTTAERRVEVRPEPQPQSTNTAPVSVLVETAPPPPKPLMAEPPASPKVARSATVSPFASVKKTPPPNLINPLYAQAAVLKQHQQLQQEQQQEAPPSSKTTPPIPKAARPVPVSVNVSGKFVKRRVGALKQHGQFRGQGSMQIKDDCIVISGKHVHSLGKRWAIGVCLFLVPFILTLGMFAPGAVLIYLAVEYLILKQETIKVPFTAFTGIATDPQRNIVAVEFSGFQWTSPAALQCAEWESFAQALTVLAPHVTPSVENPAATQGLQLMKGALANWFIVLLGVGVAAFFTSYPKREIAEVIGFGVGIVFGTAVISVIAAYIGWFVSKRSKLAASIMLFVPALLALGLTLMRLRG